MKTIEKTFKVLKTDVELGIVFGWAIICKENGEDYFDLQDDHIPEVAMLSAATDFMESARVSKDSHTGEEAGTVLFAFPMTEDIAKACGIQAERSGLLIGVKPSEAMMKRFRDGELKGFSIGGNRITDEEVSDAA